MRHYILLICPLVILVTIPTITFGDDLIRAPEIEMSPELDYSRPYIPNIPSDDSYEFRFRSEHKVEMIRAQTQLISAIGTLQSLIKEVGPYLDNSELEMIESKAREFDYEAQKAQHYNDVDEVNSLRESISDLNKKLKDRLFRAKYYKPDNNLNKYESQSAEANNNNHSQAAPSWPVKKNDETPPKNYYDTPEAYSVFETERGMQGIWELDKDGNLIDAKKNGPQKGGTKGSRSRSSKKTDSKITEINFAEVKAGAERNGITVEKAIERVAAEGITIIGKPADEEEFFEHIYNISWDERQKVLILMRRQERFRYLDWLENYMTRAR
jgi:hypothetical protein